MISNNFLLRNKDAGVRLYVRVRETETERERESEIIVEKIKSLIYVLDIKEFRDQSKTKD